MLPLPHIGPGCCTTATQLVGELGRATWEPFKPPVKPGEDLIKYYRVLDWIQEGASVSLGAYLQQVMQQQDWELGDLVAHTGVPRTTLWNIINKHQAPKLETLNQLAASLNVPLVRLLEVAGVVTSPLTGTVEQQLATLLEMNPQYRPIIDEIAQLAPDDLDKVLSYLQFVRYQRQQHQQ